MFPSGIAARRKVADAGRRLAALSTADNQASLRMLEKLGMRCCGEIHGGDDPSPYLLFELVRPGHSA